MPGQGNEKKRSVRSILRSTGRFYVALLILVCAAVFIYSSYVHYTAGLRHEGKFVSGSLKQSRVLVENYKGKLEAAAAVLIANEYVMNFDDADQTMDEFERNNMRDDVSDRVSRVGLLDNYCDFSFIYRSSGHAGRLSQESLELMTGEDTDLYESLEQKLGTNSKTWLTNVGGDGRKVFFLCRADDTKIFMGSFYTRELEGLFVDEVSFPGAGLIIADGQDETIMFGGNITDSDKARDYINKLSEEEGRSIRSIDYTHAEIIAREKLTGGWQIYCIRDMADVQREYKRSGIVTLVILLTALGLIGAFNAVVLSGDEILEAENGVRDTDPLTGLPHAEEAENLIADRLETCASGSTILIGVFCISNLDEILKNYGTSARNGALLKTTHTLAEHFGVFGKGSTNMVARTGQEEFTVYADFTQYDLFKAHDAMKKSLSELKDKLRDIHMSRPGDVTILWGTAIYPDNSLDYDELYDKAKGQVYDKFDEGVGKTDPPETDGKDGDSHEEG